VNASGVFQIDLTPELLMPFEGCGLDVAFELELPKAINNFDYRTIADVQVSIDYTALYSPDYAAQVIHQLPATTSNSILLSLADDFPDAWYALVTQAQQLAATPPPPPGSPPPPVLLATWQLSADDLPANLSSPYVDQLTLLIVRSGSVPAQFTIDHLRLLGEPALPTQAKTVGDIVSTRNGSGGAWRQLTGQGTTPIGTWELGLTPDSDTVNAIAGGDVQNIALVIGYTGSLPAWPS
jgi:Tc toxin complex TcA C-terminal TcB-binding domain